LKLVNSVHDHLLGPALKSRRKLPRIEDVDQRPGSAGQIVVKLSLLIDHELACRIQESCALGVVGVIQVELANRQVEGLGRVSGLAPPA